MERICCENRNNNITQQAALMVFFRQRQTLSAVSSHTRSSGRFLDAAVPVASHAGWIPQARGKCRQVEHQQPAETTASSQYTCASLSSAPPTCAPPQRASWAHVPCVPAG